MDIILSLIVMALFLPLFPIIAIAIKTDSKGPVFAKCDRISGGRKVKVYKFRSMIKGADKLKKNLSGMNDRADGPFFKIKNDPRVTRAGRFLRKTRIDEVPQILNVLKGEMAFVGPRPHEPAEVSEYPEEYGYVSLYKAGITGISQISGASSLNWIKELELDGEYLEKVSFGRDIKILLKTIAIFFFDQTGV